MADGCKRIFIGLIEIAGYNFSLKKGFDEVGVDSSFYDLGDNQFGYTPNSINNSYIRLVRRINRSAGATHNRLARNCWLLLYFMSIVPLFVWALLRFDVFIFSFGQSFFRLHDLPLLRRLGKKIIFVFLGSDSRPPYLNRKFHDGSSIQNTISLTHGVKANIRQIERYAHVTVNHPATAHFHEKPFVQILRLGIPTTFDCSPGIGRSNAEEAIRILHAPSVADGKGTDKIRAAITNLRCRGFNINYIEIAGRSNAEVLSEIERCDFVVDELYSDTLMARFAAEAAFYAKPAVVGGYATREDLGNLPAEDVAPVHHCHPDEIEGAVEKLISDAQYRLELGQRARQFVNSNWSPGAVARRYLRLIKGDIPGDWWYDPQDIRYIHGWGMSSAVAKDALSRYLAAGDASCLELEDKPILKGLVLCFASEKRPAC